MWFSKKKMFALTLICTALLSACGSSPKKIKVLILPKFEIGEMTGDMPGEAQLYYEEYLMKITSCMSRMISRCL